MAAHVPKDDLDKRLDHMPGHYFRPTCLQSTPSQYCQNLKMSKFHVCHEIAGMFLLCFFCA